MFIQTMQFQPDTYTESMKPTCMAQRVVVLSRWRCSTMGSQKEQIFSDCPCTFLSARGMLCHFLYVASIEHTKAQNISK